MSPVDAAAMQARIERAVGLILDDERWRMDLTDDEACPLLKWAVERAEAIARGTADETDDDVATQKIWDETAVLRDHLALFAEAVDAFRHGSDDRLARLIDEVARDLAVPTLLSRTADWIARGRQLGSADFAKEIVDVLRTSS